MFIVYTVYNLRAGLNDTGFVRVGSLIFTVSRCCGESARSRLVKIHKIVV